MFISFRSSLLPLSLATLTLIAGCFGGGGGGGGDSADGINADAGDDKQVSPGATVLLDGTQSEGDPDLSSWAQIEGEPAVTLEPVAGIPFTAQFVAPDEETELVFELTVQDEDGNQDSDAVTVTVGASSAVTADAGDDQTVTVGEEVTLDGSASTAEDGDIESYTWEPVLGTEAVLSGADEVVATFQPDEPGEYVFRLTVADGAGAEDSDNVNVTVQPDLSGAERLLFFTVADGDAENPTKSIHAVAPGDVIGPASAARAAVTAQDNSRARTDEDFFRATGDFRAEQPPVGVTWNQYEPDRTNLPLGVLTVDRDGPDREVEHHSVVFNAPNGWLWRAHLDDGRLMSSRVSGETEAGVVCAARVLGDHADVMNTRIVYQMPRDGDGDCNRTTWRMARLGANVSEDPVTLVEEFDYGTFRKEFSLDWAMAVRDGSGALEKVIIYQGDMSIPGDSDDLGDGTLIQYDIATGATGPALRDNSNFDGNTVQVRKLGRGGASGEELVINAWGPTPGDMGTILVYDRDEGEFGAAADEVGSAVNAATVERSITGQEQAVTVDGRVYIADIRDGNASSGRLAEVDPDARVGGFIGRMERIDVNWGSPRGVPMITAAGDRIAWAYINNTSQDIELQQRRIRSNVTDGSSALQIADGDILFGFPQQTPTAPHDWVFYNRFELENGVPRSEEAVAVDIAGEGMGTMSIDDAEWLGTAWSDAIPESGEEATHVFYFRSVAGSDRLKARPVDGLVGGSIVDFNEQPDGGRNNGDRWIGGYGPEILIGWRRPLTSSGVVYYADAEDAGSLVRVTEPGTTASPISFH